MNPAPESLMSRSVKNSVCENTGVDAPRKKGPSCTRPSDRQRIYKALQRYLGTGLSDVKQLQGSSNLYRLRVGDWRAVFTLEEGGVLRSEIYR